MGLVGHTGTDGSDHGTRLNRYGEWAGSAAENIAYLDGTGTDIVMMLFVDDGV